MIHALVACTTPDGTAAMCEYGEYEIVRQFAEQFAGAFGIGLVIGVALVLLSAFRG